MLTVDNVSHLLNVRVGKKAKDSTIKHYAIDSRAVKKGSLFFAIKGERTDGHLFLTGAKKNGAIAYVIDKKFKSKDLVSSYLGSEGKTFFETTDNVYFVDDTIHALQSLAQKVTSKKNDTTIAITGSCGKTTVKELLVTVLATKFKVGCNHGNFNNHIGAPLSMLNTAWDNDMYVAEIGASKRGDIAELCSIVQPDLGIITNIAPAHLEGFGSLQGVYETKTEIGHYLVTHGGTVIADADDEKLISILDGCNVNRVTFGMKKGADFQATVIEEHGNKIVVRINNKTEIPLDMLAILNVKNALAVFAAANLIGINIERIKELCSTFKPPKGRFSRIKKGALTIIDDCYNANPASFQNSLSLYSQLTHSGRKVLVCADMLELGEQSDQLHKEVGSAVKQSGFGLVIGIGQGGGLIAQECKIENEDGRDIYCAASNTEALEILRKELRDDDMILFKGSRGMHLEEIIEKL